MAEANEKTLKEVIDVEFLQQFQDAFSDATGMASIIVDMEDSVTKPSNFTDFCIGLTRGTKEGLRRCVQCDIKAGEESKRTGRPSVYYCHAGLMDFGAPIIVNGTQVGSILGGQVLTSEPDEDKFRNIAKELGIDEDKYIEALRKVKIVPESQVRGAAELLFITIDQITKGISNYEHLKESYIKIEEEISAIHKKIEDIKITNMGLNDDQKNLVVQVESIIEILDSINGVAKSVAKNSERTQLISLNASIEAARSGLAGRGFSVIANSIKNLATESKNTVKKIEKHTNTITESVRKLLSTLKIHSNTFASQIGTIDDVFPILNDILDEMKHLT